MTLGIAAWSGVPAMITVRQLSWVTGGSMCSAESHSTVLVHGIYSSLKNWGSQWVRHIHGFVKVYIEVRSDKTVFWNVLRRYNVRSIDGETLFIPSALSFYITFATLVLWQWQVSSFKILATSWGHWPSACCHSPTATLAKRAANSRGARRVKTFCGGNPSKFETLHEMSEQIYTCHYLLWLWYVIQ